MDEINNVLGGVNDIDILVLCECEVWYCLREFCFRYVIIYFDVFRNGYFCVNFILYF